MVVLGNSNGRSVRKVRAIMVLQSLSQGCLYGQEDLEIGLGMRLVLVIIGKVVGDPGDNIGI